MENLEINNGNGQSYGYVIYRHLGADIKDNTKLQLKNGAIFDMGIVLLDGVRKTEKLTSEKQLQGFGFWEKK